MNVVCRIMETGKGVGAYLRSRLPGGYGFSSNDLLLYLNERCGPDRPPVNVISRQDDGLDLLEIGERRIFWPSQMSSGDLSWLFAEIFAPWEGNPSSYDHPALSLRDAQWVIDAGACEGFFSLFALERFGGRIIAVEPLEALWPALRRTFAREMKEGRFELFEGALGREKGKTHISLDPLHACEAAVAPTETGSPVAQTTLDDLRELHGLGSGGMIKMDIEGAEMDALQGGVRLLADHRPRLAVAVYHGYDNARLCAEIIRRANPSYTIEFRGMYGWFHPARPYMLFAW
jgi:FkbM family methyltransferase